MIYCPEFIVSYVFVLFYFVLISLLNSQMIFLLLVLSSSRVHGRLFREIIDANGAKEITTQDNSFSKFLGPKEVVNDAFEELSETEDMDKGKRKATQRELFVFSLLTVQQKDRKKVCSGAKKGCRCQPFRSCGDCACPLSG